MIDSKFIALVPQVAKIIAQASEIAEINPAIPKVLTTFAVVFEQGEKAYEDLVDLRALVKLMVAESREPTQAEWDALRIRSDAAHEAIQSYDVDRET